MNARVDITQELCPMTYVRVKLALEKLATGDLLEIWLKGDEPVKNVPKSARDEGHQVVSLEPRADGSMCLLLKVNSHGHRSNTDSASQLHAKSS